MRACSKSVLAADATGVRSASRVLAAGGLVVYPTETVYGLAADATNAKAVERLVALKGREPGKAIALLVADRAMAESLALGVPPAAALMMERFWPGPLTIVLDAQPSLPAPLTAGTGTIGLRVSSHPVATALVRALGRPVTAPSANPAGCRAPVCVEAALAYFGEGVELYLDGGRVAGEPSSTVVDARDAVRVLRAGAISPVAVRAAVATRAAAAPAEETRESVSARKPS